jgi:hypothetical protein
LLKREVVIGNPLVKLRLSIQQLHVLDLELLWAILISRISNMGLAKKILIVVLAISAVFYIAGSVISVSFNLADWEKGTREILTAFWLIAMIVSNIPIFASNDINSEI